MKSEETLKRVLRSVQTMAVLADCMEIEMSEDLSFSKFADPNMNNHVRKIKDSIVALRAGINRLVKTPDQEFVTFEHSPQAHRLFKFFSTMSTTQLTEYLDLLETVPTEQEIIETVKRI